MKKSIWLDDPTEHDYPAAQDYLELLFEPEEVTKIVTKLKHAKTISKKSRDILRASKLPLLPKDNIHVQTDLKKFKKEKKLPPVLLVRHDTGLIIADGYHRICSAYYLTEDLDVRCRLV